MTQSRINKTLNFLIWNGGQPISRTFDICDSDANTNLIHMEQVVGTLIRHASDTEYQPQLAVSWTISQDKKEYEFELDPSAVDELGHQIDARKWRDSLLRSLQIYKKQGHVPIFSSLVGGENFHTSKGIEVTGEFRIKFRFTEKIDGFYEYLSMPYFGFLAPENYNENLEWRNPRAIVSSGAYRLKSWNKKTDIIQLSVRGSGSKSSKIPNEIFITTPKSRTIFERVRPHTIISFSPDETIVPCSAWTTLRGSPTITFGLNLNPNCQISDGLRDPTDRKNLYSFLSSRLRPSLESLKYAKYSNAFFYPLGEHPTSNSEEKLKLKKPITIVSPRSQTSQYAQTILQNTIRLFDRENIEYKLFELPRKAALCERKKLLRENCDLFVTGVDRGPQPESWSLEMMFNSKLGVELSDPSGKIKTLVENMRILPTDKANDLEKFEAILQEDSTYLPLLHYGEIWLYDADTLDLSALENIGATRFDLVQFK